MRTLRASNENIDISQIKYKFFVLDTETTKLEPMKKNFVFGVIYGYEYCRVIYSVEDFQKELRKDKYKNKIIFAHNAEFDLLTIYGNIYQEIDNAAVFNGKFISAKRDKVIFGDSMNIYPTSVEKIGKMIGIEKLENKKVKASGLTKENRSAQDIEYCKRDCEIVWKALLRAFELTGNIKLTLPSLAMYDFRHTYMNEDIVFSELVDEFYESYYGGRTEAFIIGKVKANVYDINSMYPHAMKTCTFPDIKHLHKETKVDIRFLLFALKYYEGMAKVTVKHKETYIGYLPCRTCIGKITKLVFPVGEFETTVNFNELRYGIDSGVVEILKVHYVVWGNPIESPFIKFVDDNFRLRNESKNELNRSYYKLKLNALYGRFAMQMKLTTTYYDEIPFDIIEELKEADKYCDLQLFNQSRSDCYLITENEKFKNSFFSIPTFSSYITSEARINLLKTLKANERNKIAYCDTDSIFLLGDFCGSVSDNLGDFKKEEKTVLEISGLKNYKYADSSGKVYTVIKGISKNAVKNGDKYIIQKYYKTKEALRRNKDAGEAYIMEKNLVHIYDKRIILKGGNTKPLKLKL